MLYEVEFQFVGGDSMNTTLTGPAFTKTTEDLAEGKPAILGTDNGYTIVFPNNLKAMVVRENFVDC